MTSPSQEELEDRLERFSRLLRLGHTAEALEAFQVLWESGQEVEVVLRLWQQRIRAVSKLSPAVAACSSWLVDAIGNGNVMRGMTRRFTFHALPLLLVAMRDTNEAVRQDAVRMLGHLGVASEEVLSRLVKAMRDPLRNVRCQAIDSLGRLGAMQSALPMMQRFQLSTRTVRFSLLEALGRIDTSSAREFLRPFLQERDTDMQYKAALALARSGSDEVLPFLIQRLYEEDINLFAIDDEAVQLLGNMRAKLAAPELRYALAFEKLPESRAIVIRALRQIGDTHHTTIQRFSERLGSVESTWPDAQQALWALLSLQQLPEAWCERIQSCFSLWPQQAKFWPVASCDEASVCLQDLGAICRVLLWLEHEGHRQSAEQSDEAVDIARSWAAWLQEQAQNLTSMLSLLSICPEPMGQALQDFQEKALSVQEAVVAALHEFGSPALLETQRTTMEAVLFFD